MNMRKCYIPYVSVSLLALVFIVNSRAQENPSDEKPKDSSSVSATDEKTDSSKDSPSSSTPAKPSEPKHAAILKDSKEIVSPTGDPPLIKLFQKDNHLYAELSGSNYSSEYIVLISIARGIGQGSLLGGMSWNFGDDWVWQFRKVDNRVLILRKNVRFKAEPGSRESYAVANAYTDSVLFSLPILTKGPKGGDLVDLSSVFMSDLPQISRFLPGFAFASNKSLWASVKGFKDNLELQVAATYSSSGRQEIDSVADSRGVTVNVHYSISQLPKSNGYKPRLADDRVGYFLTVVKDYSKNSDRDHFIRYINRWHLQKDDSSAKLSPPKEPIVFWIEKTVPAKFRPAIQAGILEWNKAFEKAGFANAIEVRTQPVDASWDPEDINYNTFRWITSSAGFAMGPSRVNPYTGQILDADIIFDADFLTFWKEEFDTLTPQSIAAMTGGPLGPDHEAAPSAAFVLAPHHKYQRCMLSEGMARQLAFGATAMMSEKDAKKADEEQEKLIMQGLKEVTMHEVGHTLGLRHNFKASTWLSLKEMNEPEKTKDGMVASVMDYNPSNIVPKGWTQGDYFPTTIGPYDVWAVQYGYTPFSGGTTGEVKELQQIASRSGEPGLAYATDEDTLSSDPDPLSNRFDQGDDPLQYAQMRAEAVRQLIPGLVDRMTKEGDDYVQARRAFNVLLSEHGRGMYYASRYIGGLHTSRSHKGDKDAKPPIEVISPEKQREAMKLLEEGIFSDEPFEFPREMYNYLGPTRWLHWGSSPTARKDFPIHDVVSMWQEQVLFQLMSPITLERIHDTELKIPTDQDAFSTAELLQRLTKSVFSEVSSIQDAKKYTDREPAVSSLRRNLQRVYLRHLSNLALGRTSAPDDCQTIAYAELAALQGRINKLFKSKPKLDSYSKAHLQESASRIRKVLDADLSLSGS